MDRDAVLRKIRACLRLAGSSNLNEAASALRQARALMEKYGLDESDAAASEINNHGARTRYRGGELPRSLLTLALMVADGYRCQVVMECDHGMRAVGVTGTTALRFFGAGSDPEIAVYAFTVLQRQLDADRRRHIARVRKAANRERRGEEFARGWVHAVGALFPAADMPEGRELAIQRSKETRCGSLKPTGGRELRKGRSNADDHYAGHAAGRTARLDQGLHGSGQLRLAGSVD